MEVSRSSLPTNINAFLNDSYQILLENKRARIQGIWPGYIGDENHIKKTLGDVPNSFNKIKVKIPIFPLS